MYRKGFTLIELLVVVGIIGLLSVIIFASLSAAKEKSRIAAGRSFAAQLDRVSGDLLTGKWEFDECSGVTASDGSGSAYTGTLTAGPTWSTDTPSGTGCSLSFSGANFVSIPDNYSLDIGLGSATRTAWFKTSLATQVGIIRKSDSSGTNGMMIILIAGGQAQCTVGFSPATSATTPGKYNDGVWHHVACVYDRATNIMSLYLDGLLRATGDISSQIGIDLNATSPFYIPAGAGTLTGLVDSVHAYAKSFTAMDVRKLYLAESKKFSEFAGR